MREKTIPETTEPNTRDWRELVYELAEACGEQGIDADTAADSVREACINVDIREAGEVE